LLLRWQQAHLQDWLYLLLLQRLALQGPLELRLLQAADLEVSAALLHLMLALLLVLVLLPLVQPSA
jgi:hypothetical protein